MEAIALHDFNTEETDELPFKKGQTLKILSSDQDKNWHRAELDGREGFIPKNYVNVKEHSWYAGKVTRKEAEAQLSNQNLDGAFLIRDSESTPGDFSLSVKHSNKVQHFKVLRDGAGKYFLWVVKFNSLHELVEYHRTSSVSRSQVIYLKDMTEAPAEPVVRYRAAFDFAAQDDEEVSFLRGDIVEVTQKYNENWWIGKVKGQSGMFPASYVKKFE
eukprot:gene9112-10085_t